MIKKIVSNGKAENNQIHENDKIVLRRLGTHKGADHKNDEINVEKQADNPQIIIDPQVVIVRGKCPIFSKIGMKIC